MLSKTLTTFWRAPSNQSISSSNSRFFTTIAKDYPSLKLNNLSRLNFEKNVFKELMSHLKLQYPHVWTKINPTINTKASAPQATKNIVDYLKNTYPDVLLNTQKYLLESFFDTSKMSPVTHTELSKGSTLIGFGNHTFPLLDGIVTHPNDLSHHLFLFDRAKAKDLIIESQVKDTLTCLKSTIKIDGQPITFLLLDYAKLSPINTFSSFSKQIISSTKPKGP